MAGLAAGLVHAAVLLAVACASGGDRSRLSEPGALAFLALWSGWSALEAALSCAGREAEGRTARRERALAALGGVALLALACQGLRAAPDWGTGGPWPWLAAAALVAGVAVRLAAVWQLEARFVSAARADAAAPLATRGVYGLVRHPSEAGLLVAALAGAVLLRSAAGLALWAVALLPLSLARVRREEQVLREAYGPAHDRYRRATGALLPRLPARRLS